MSKYVVSIYDELTEKKSSHALEDISTYPTARLSFDAIENIQEAITELKLMKK